MSRSVNKAILIGNLGQDPDVRTTAGGARVANLSVATSRRWTGRDGQEQEKTEWHRVVAWNGGDRGPKLADVAERYLKKGDKVYVEGEIEYRSYEDAEGTTRYVTEIRARELVLLGGRETGGAETGTRSTSRPQSATAGAGAARSGGGSSYDDFPGPAEGIEDDLPF